MIKKHLKGRGRKKQRNSSLSEDSELFNGIKLSTAV